VADTPSSLKLIVGLGNPGPQYAHTRHNAGFWFVDELARCHDGQLRSETKFNGEACRIDLAGQTIWLLKPLTFMNRSGQAVERLADFFKIPPSAILIAHDELDLPPGVVRLKREGGHGGHNGLRSIINHLGSKQFLRLRLGIGHPGDSRDVVDYVLRRAPQAEQQSIERALEAAVAEFPRLAEGQLERVMNTLHTFSAAAPEEPPAP